MYEHKDQVAISASGIMARFKKILEQMAKNPDISKENEAPV